MDSMKIQRQERNTFYYLPVHCGFYGQLVVNGDAEEHAISPCAHTLFIAHDQAFEFLADCAVTQLKEKGFDVEIQHDYIEVSATTDEQPDDPDGITDLFEFEDAVKVASYVSPPSSFGTYVEFAPIENNLLETGRE